MSIAPIENIESLQFISRPILRASMVTVARQRVIQAQPLLDTSNSTLNIHWQLNTSNFCSEQRVNNINSTLITFLSPFTPPFLEHIYENNNRKVRVRLFAVRTVLWGSPNVTGSQWPVVEPGQHRFPFLCELPLVNYPPTFRHHLASCEFEILATLERPGIRPFQTIPVDIRYQPLVLTTSLKIPPAYQEEVNISNTKIIMTLPRGISYNLLDANSRGCLIDVKLTFPDGHPSISNMEASLRRQVHVSCRDYQQTDSMTMTHVEQSAFRTHEKSYYIKIPIPTENNPLNTPAIQRNFSVLGMTTSLVGHSRYTQVTYRLVITARIRHGFLFHKRTLFSTVIQMGTLSPGAQVPSSVFSCSSVPSNATMSIKPRFLYVPGTQEQLPAYQDEPSPPQYSL